MPEQTTEAPARPLPPREAQERYARTFNTSLIAASLSATLSFPEPADRVLVRVDPVLPFHRGGMGTDAINGGMLAALFDFVIGTTPALVDPTRRSATMQLNITFEQPVKGDWFIAEGRIDRAGASTIFASAVVKDSSGAICSRCSGMAKLGRQPWPAGGQNEAK